MFDTSFAINQFMNQPAFPISILRFFEQTNYFIVLPARIFHIFIHKEKTSIHKKRIGFILLYVIQQLKYQSFRNSLICIRESYPLIFGLINCEIFLCSEIVKFANDKPHFWMFLSDFSCSIRAF